MEIPSLLDVLKFSYSKKRDVVLYNRAGKPNSELYHVLEITNTTHSSYKTKVIFRMYNSNPVGTQTYLYTFCNSEEDALLQFKTCLGDPDYPDPDLIPDPIAMLHILTKKGHSITECRKFIRGIINSIAPSIFRAIYEEYKSIHIRYFEFADKEVDNIVTWISPGLYGIYPLETYKYLGSDKGTEKLLNDTK